MTPRQRHVRVAQSFFDVADDLLPDARGPNGEPCVHDFISIDLEPVVRKIALWFDQLPLIADGLPTGRVLVGAGVMVRRFAVYAVEANDGSVDIVGLTIEP